MIGVYKITNLISGNFYIGSSSHNLKIRKRRHFDDMRKGIHHNLPLQNAYNKVGSDNLKFEILCFTKKEETLAVEQLYIDWFKPSYNICKEARSVSGLKRSEVFCEEIKNRMKGNSIWKGRVHTEEAKNKISEANKGRLPYNTGKKRDEATKLKISLSNKGSKRSLDQKIKMSISAHNKKEVINLSTGVVFESVKEACNCHNLNYSYIIQVLSGKIKTNKTGFIFV